MTLTAARQVGGGAAGVFAAYALVLRPRIQWLATSKEERTATYPGDDLIPSGRRYGAMATTIAPPPECVWPWLVQMGCDRAGRTDCRALTATALGGSSCGQRSKGTRGWS